MAASQVALWASTGNVVIGVFHTESDGKEGQSVPGRIGPPAAAVVAPAFAIAGGGVTATPGVAHTARTATPSATASDARFNG
jgi:hypothetical protein